MCEKEQIDLLLIAGDLFHRQPLMRELKEVDYLFSGLTKTRVVLVAGNHDYIKKDSYYRNFGWGKNVHMLSSQQPEAIVLPELDTAVYGLSYHSREIESPLYDEILPTENARYHILLAHGGDERHIPVKINNLIDKRYDYIALGHIHKPQELVPDRAAYAGALEPIDKNDIGEHGLVKGELNPNGCKTEFVPFASREYIHMEMEICREMTGFALRDKIHEQIANQGVQNIYKIILTGFRDPEVMFDLESMDVFGNIVEIVDQTKPAYDFEKLWRQNRDNLIGRYIESFEGCSQEGVEYQALCEGIHALMETKRV